MSSAELFSAVARLQVRAVVRGGGGDPACACACACVVSFDVWREALSSVSLSGGRRHAGAAAG